MPLAYLTALAWALYLADIGPNETQVLLAAIGAFSSTLTALLLGRERRDRKAGQQRQLEAIRTNQLVAMVPEHIVQEVQGTTGPPPPPHDPAP